MHLKNLSVFGFKSFADRTTLEFQPGITAIVGPNGCGKSNVADAIRWVLGEQSAKALRGGEMADVIFNGAETRKALGIAEVSLTIGGMDQENLKAAGVPIEYDEVTLTRKVSRDGGSNYYLNKIPCRLKDIQQLFAGTGVGRTSYSIMAQGNITQILSSRPEERRLVFEEAAGITRFKAQKKEALRKLERTEQNLLRVADLVREVKRQIGSLQRQAGKARRYQKFMAELQHLETQLARHEYDGLLAAVTEREEGIEALRRDIETASETVLRAENELGTLRERLAALEHEINQRQQRGLELRSEIERHESRIQYNEQRLGELESRNAEALAEIEQSEARRREAEQELAGLARQLAEVEGALAAQREEQAAKRAAVEAVERELQLRQERLRTLNNDLFRAAQELSRLRNQVSALDLQKQNNRVRLDKLGAEKVQLEEERRETLRRIEAFAQDSEARERSVEARRLELEQRQRRLGELQQRIEALTAELDQAQREQAANQSRRAVLEQLEASHEGFDAGVLAALQREEAVLGTLADRVRAPDEHLVAVEAALGHHLQLVLAEQSEAARGILDELHAGRKGRASIAALALRNGDFPEGRPVESDPRLAGLSCRPILAEIEADAAVQGLVAGLLGRTQLVPDLETATRAWEATGGAFDFVTPRGEVLSRHGIFTGGLGQEDAGAAASSILGRKNEIAELAARATELEARTEELSRELGALQGEVTALQAGLQESRTELQAQEVELATRQGEFNALQNAARLLEQKIETVLFEIESLGEQQREDDTRREQLAAEVTAAEQGEAAVRAELEQLNAGLEELRQRRDEVVAVLTRASVELAKLEENHAALEQRRNPLQRRIRELEQLVTRRRRQIESVLQQRGQAEAEIEESRGRIGALRHEREQVNETIAGLAGERAGVQRGIEEREQLLRDERGRLTRLQERRNALEVEVAQKQVAIQNLKERIQQKYHVDLDEIRGECIRITYANDGPARVETVSPGEMEDAGVGTDWEAVAKQVAALQERIERMGPVNLVAIEEYEETEQRYKFLSEQHQDLVEARKELGALITRINQQTKEMFAETFEKIRVNFRDLFQEVFGGGKADLQLVDQENILESGIEIVARPPGKQLQNIRLLSGGEQTMTAVALLFAIYEVRPSPFCVLDELDAPLDEANINRFTRVLKRFLDRSQFIIMTHNKRTIAMADVIYGVTMEERGVSKVMSMKFQRDSADNGPGRLVAGETPAASGDAGGDESASPSGNGNGRVRTGPDGNGQNGKNGRAPRPAPAPGAEAAEVPVAVPEVAAPVNN
jgi:chromosome segregation protein